jgi:predicted MFS family arabinose efflux permease
LKNFDSFSLLPVITLILLSVVLGTSEFIIIGILPDIALSINSSIAMIGNLVSIFALVYAIGTFIITPATSSLNRYYLIIILTIIFIIGNVLFALADSYLFLILARMLIAVVSGVILAISMTFSAEIAGPAIQPKIISWIFSGFSMAAVFGVPTGTFITHLLGWRTAFLLLSFISLIILLMLIFYLPNTGSGQKSNILRQLGLLKKPHIQLGIMIVICGAASTYVFYTYLTPILQKYLFIPERYISLILIGFGVSTIISNFLSGHIALTGGMRRMPLFFLIQALFLSTLFLTIKIPTLCLINIFIIGTVMYLQNSPTQLHFLNTAVREKPEAINFSASLVPISFNIGIALGSACGSLVVIYSSMQYVGLWGAAIACGAVFFNLKLLKT